MNGQQQICREESTPQPAGLAGGNLRGDVRSTSSGNIGLATQTMLRAADCSMTDFGTRAGRLDATITEIEL